MSIPPEPPSRRTFLAASIGAGMLSAAEPEPVAPAPLLDVDYRKLVSRADLVYEKPVPRSEEGIPIGNGRMGSLVWTTPTQLRLQINRVNVYASNCASNSFFERHTDYCGGCGFVDIDFGTGTGAAPFPESGFGQHLGVYDGALRIEGKGLTARLLAWPEHDVMAISVDGGATPVVRLRMLRFEANSGQSEKLIRDHIAVVQTRNHTAASQLIVREDRVALCKIFAKAISVANRQWRSASWGARRSRSCSTKPRWAWPPLALRRIRF